VLCQSRERSLSSFAHVVQHEPDFWMPTAAADAGPPLTWRKISSAGRVGLPLVAAMLDAQISGFERLTIYHQTRLQETIIDLTSSTTVCPATSGSAARIRRRPRVGGWRLRVALVTLTVTTAALAQSPLAPVDAQSPRAALESFLALTGETARSYAAFRDNPSRSTQAALTRTTERAARLFDLSEVAPAIRGRVGAETYYLLWDVIARIELPDVADVPDEADVLAAADSAAPLLHWRIPGTEITLSQMADGPQAGQFLFSAATVAAAQGYYAAVADLPYVRPTPIDDVYQLYRTSTGWMLPPRMIEALPEWANVGLGGQVFWKSVVLVLLVAIAAGAFVLVLLHTRRGAADHTVHSYLRRLSAPVVLVAAAFLVQWLARWQINVSGPISRVPDLLQEVAAGVAALWIIWTTAHWVSDRIIASPNIPTNSLNAHLIRFAARSVGLLAAIVLLFNAARDIGIPVYGLVAGAGIGGLAVALAVRTTLENIVGTLTIYADRPVQLGDRCIFGEHRSDGIPREGTIEEIGLRSTRIRGVDRSITTIPNGEFANMHIVNLQKRDRRLFDKTIGVRYETTPKQLERILDGLGEMLAAETRISQPEAFARLSNLGASSIDIRISAYVLAANRSEFFRFQEEILMRIMQIVVDSGSALAFPSVTVYQARDALLAERALDGELARGET
jgi:MscS family membrane protein